MKPPLAEKLRPQSLDEVIGQEHLIGKDGFLRHIVEGQRPLSLLLWGPPGSGKTTLARLYAKAFPLRFASLSAIFGSINDLKKIVKESEDPLFGPVLLFIDEIHRFNKAQQDAFLPFLEKGNLIIIGTTTENPSFALNKALLSRLRVLVLKTLDDDDLLKLLLRYETQCGKLPLEEEAKKFLVQQAGGDGRYLYNLIENLQGLPPSKTLSKTQLMQYLQKRAASFDRAGEGHYNTISALHKAVRGSDPDAALYWLARMLEGGEDPLFICRRMIRMANEDVGLADPMAVDVALQAQEVYQRLGSPEGELALAQACVYLALAPKSNAIYTAFKQAKALAKETSHLEPPFLAINAPTALMEEIGYGKGYVYDHDTKEGFSGQNYFPDNIGKRPSFYHPVERGFEREMQKRLHYFANLRASFRKSL